MDEELQKYDPRISNVVEIIIIGIFYGLLDLIDLIPIAGDITAVIAAPMVLYYFSKDLNAITFVVAEILDAIPFTQEIPSRTISWIATVILDRNRKRFGKLEAAMEVVDALEGNVGELEGEAAGTTLAETEGRYQAGAKQAGEAEAPGSSADKKDRENSRPSEKSTERGGGSTTEQGENPQTQQELRDQEKQKDYEEMMETDAQHEPIEVAQKEDFGEKGPPQPIEQEPEEENESTKRLSQRFAVKQQEMEDRRRQAKAEEQRKQLEQLKQSESATREEAA